MTASQTLVTSLFSVFISTLTMLEKSSFPNNPFTTNYASSRSSVFYGRSFIFVKTKKGFSLKVVLAEIC